MVIFQIFLYIVGNFPRTKKKHLKKRVFYRNFIEKFTKLDSFINQVYFYHAKNLNDAYIFDIINTMIYQ